MIGRDQPCLLRARVRKNVLAGTVLHGGREVPRASCPRVVLARRRDADEGHHRTLKVIDNRVRAERRPPPCNGRAELRRIESLHALKAVEANRASEDTRPTPRIYEGGARFLP